MLLGNCKAAAFRCCTQLGKLHFSIVAAADYKILVLFQFNPHFYWRPLVETLAFLLLQMFYCVFLVNPSANVTLCLCPSVSYLFCRKVASTSDFAPLTLHYTTFYTIHAQKKMPTNTLFGSDRNHPFNISTRFFLFVTNFKE